MNLATSLSTTTQVRACFDRCPDCKRPMTVEVLDGAPAIDVTVLCDECANRRYARMERAEIQDKLRVRYRTLLHRGLVGDEIQACSWSTSSPEITKLNESAWRDGRGWWRCGEKNLYIYGAVGVGKTWMARACLREGFVSGRSVAEVTARRLCKVADTFREGDGLFSAWKAVGVLLIDDLDKAAWSMDRVDALWEILDARSASRLRTVVCANLSPEKMLDVLKRACVHHGEENQSHAVAAVDRLKPATKLELVGESQRRRVGG